MNRKEKNSVANYYKDRLNNYETILKDTGNNLIKYPIGSYNCMGYALGFYDWLDLDSFYGLTDDGDMDFTKEDLDVVLNDCIEELESRFDAVEIKYEDIDKLPSNKRAIAFRIGGDDFHFARRNSDGTWSHKPGGYSVRNMSEEELLGDEWEEHRDYSYCSNICFLAVDFKYAAGREVCN